MADGASLSQANSPEGFLLLNVQSFDRKSFLDYLNLLITALSFTLVNYPIINGSEPMVNLLYQLACLCSCYMNYMFMSFLIYRQGLLSLEEAPEAVPAVQGLDLGGAGHQPRRDLSRMVDGKS